MPLYGNRLKELRKQKGLSQQDLADRLHVSQQQVGRWEAGTSDATADAVARIARVMECTADWLLGLVDKPHQKLQPKDLTPDEQRLLDLYRQRKLPQIISRLVNELSRPNAQEDLVVDSEDEAGIVRDEETSDS